MLKRSIVLLVALFIFASQAYSETVDEIIAKNIKAHGGQEKFEDMNTYQLEMKMNDYGYEHSIKDIYQKTRQNENGNVNDGTEYYHSPKRR
jgi:hypothetical protein